MLWFSSDFIQYLQFYISDMPETKLKKFGYANDLAFAIEVDSYEEGKMILEEDVKNLFDYYTISNLNPTKIEVSILHQNNKLASKSLVQ